MTLFAAIASLGLVGCIGALEPVGPGQQGDDDDDGQVTPPPDKPDAGGGGGATEEGRALFDSTVAPAMAQCGTAGCHGGTGNSPLKFIPDNTAGMYDVVTSYDDRVVGYFDKTVAPMLKRVAPGPHYTASYTPAQVTAIEAWLDKELELRSGGGGMMPPPGGGTMTPGQVSKQLISEWSGCMDLALWNQLEVAEGWANKGSGEGVCEKCHVNGQASFIATRDSDRMFQVLTTNKYYMLAYFTPNVTDLANAKMEINRSLLERVGNAEYPYIEHPQFNVDGTAYSRLQEFYDQTMAKKAAGTCGPPVIMP
jgi:hypothetical protein